MTIFVRMVFPENFEEKIGFDRIRESVRSYCLSESASALLNAEGFITDFEKIRERLLRVREFLVMMSEEDFAMDPYPDIRESLGKITIQGSYLEVSEVAGLRQNLNVAKGILNFFRRSGNRDKFPAISGICAEIKIYPYVPLLCDLLFC